MQISPQNTKKQVLEAIQALPDDTTFEEMMYRLYVLEKISKAQQAVEQGETISLDALRKEVDTW